jgi:hypothetical protein
MPFKKEVSSQTDLCRSYIATDGQSASSSWCRDPFGTDDKILIFFNDNYFHCSSCKTLCLTRGRAVICSAITNWLESRRPTTICYSLIWDSLTPECQVPVFTSPRKSGPVLIQSQTSKSRYDRQSVNRMSWCRVQAALEGLHLNEFYFNIRSDTLGRNC